MSGLLWRLRVQDHVTALLLPLYGRRSGAVPHLMVSGLHT